MDFHNGIGRESRDEVYSRLRADSLSSEQSDTSVTSDLDTAPLLLVMGTKLYKRRWAMLFVFSAYSMSNAFMWPQYTIISNIFIRFYRTSSQAIDWLSMIYFVSYILLVLPVAWLLEKRGLREVVLIGSALNSIGAWIKTGAIEQDLYAIAFLGQFVSSVASVFVLGIPSKLASSWFGEREVSTACSIGVLGNQVRLSCVCLLNFFEWMLNASQRSIKKTKLKLGCLILTLT